MINLVKLIILFNLMKELAIVLINRYLYIYDYLILICYNI